MPNSLFHRPSRIRILADILNKKMIPAARHSDVHVSGSQMIAAIKMRIIETIHNSSADSVPSVRWQRTYNRNYFKDTLPTALPANSSDKPPQIPSDEDAHILFRSMKLMMHLLQKGSPFPLPLKLELQHKIRRQQFYEVSHGMNHRTSVHSYFGEGDIYDENVLQLAERLARVDVDPEAIFFHVCDPLNEPIERLNQDFWTSGGIFFVSSHLYFSADFYMCLTLFLFCRRVVA